MIKTIIKPFEKFQKKQLLTFGIGTLLPFSVLAFFLNTRFDGIFDMHNTRNLSFHQPLLDNITDTIVLTLCLYGLAYFVTPKTRWVDLINIALLCRIPFYISALFNINNISLTTGEFLIDNIANPIAIFDLPLINLIVFFTLSLYSLLALALFGILLCNGFKTATNLKKTTHKLLLIPIIILAEVISKFLICLY